MTMTRPFVKPSIHVVFMQLESRIEIMRESVQLAVHRADQTI